MVKLTVFANFRIDNKERYLRMKDSFFSFQDISAEKWVVNVRGKYKKQVLKFLRQNLKEKLCAYELESDKGWFYDTREMLTVIHGDYVLFWIEDHINLVSIGKYDQILTEMKRAQSDHLVYTWFGNNDIFKPLTSNDSKNIKTIHMNKAKVDAVENENNSYFYMISAASICSIKLFNKIIKSNHPYLKRWSKETPFDFEKRSTDVEFLPFNLSISKCELFASIDDNLGMDGYYLIDRGLYPDRARRHELQHVEYSSAGNIDFIKKITPKYIYKHLSSVYTLIRRIFYTIN